MTAVFLFFDKRKHTHSGGSGCGCCGTVFQVTSLINYVRKRNFKKILLVATGALMNSTSSQQG